MKQSTTTIGASQKLILAYNSPFHNINIKVAKTAITAQLVNGILPAGLIVNSSGVVANDAGTGATALGVVYEDVDFNNSTGTEVVPITIFGFVKTSALPAAPAAEAKAALKMIQFL